ncbi:MAG: LPS export ABC transporter ATP-binding protein [bacterium]|nr:LPS export ABC transporter ATP-binding protein [bacterium]
MITLRTEHLVKIYGKRKVVNDVGFQVSQGEIVGLLGPNGAGKTTSFYMTVGMIKPDGGKIFIGDVDCTTLPMYKRARHGVGYLAQEPSVFRKLTVWQNMIAILETLPLNKKQRLEKAESLLDEFGLQKVRNSKAYTLSGGERRRTEIARALTTDPKFLLLDEPFAGIDPIAVQDIQSIVRDLKRRGIGVLITDHNVRETMAICERAYLLYTGSILISGTAQELADNPDARKLYLGERFKLDTQEA